ncbi:peptidylprolyl isomerase [Formosa sp. S-31]|uniref:peptidylprolyl isomerase n=1 Tax=Formosa sp. S-31 TaxID=2790949 RepID=UPI003EBC34F5
MRAFTLVFLLALSIISCKAKKTYDIGQIKTPQGEMLFWMYDKTANHKANFIKLAEAHYWDSLHFNRVIKDFVIQGGCPDTPEGFSDSPYLIDPEFHPDITHTYGAVGFGRDDNAKKQSAGCQIYIINNKDGVHRLDGDYMIFGQLFKGYDVLETISNLPTDETDQPLQRVNMEVHNLKLTKKELDALGYDGPIIQ